MHQDFHELGIKNKSRSSFFIYSIIANDIEEWLSDEELYY